MRLGWLLAAVLIGATGCPHAGQGFGPDLPSQGRKEARSRFDRARTSFAQSDYQEAKKEMDAVVHEYPEDPITPFAALYSSIAELRLGSAAGAGAELRLANAEGAARELRKLADDATAPDQVRERARFFLGLADAQLGKAAEARNLLTPFRGKIEDPEENGELHAALASTAAQAGDPTAALVEYDAFWKVARPAERVFITAQVAGIVDKLADDGAGAAYDRLDKDGPGAAFLGRRLAAAARAAGNADLARRIASETAAARAGVGLGDNEPAADGKNQDPQLVGALLPISGKRHLVGEAALRGVALAAGTYDRSGGGGVAETGMPRPFAAAVEDAGDGKGRIAAAVDAIAATGAVAAVGPLDHDAVEEAARRAEELGLPLVTLDVSDKPSPAGAPHVFCIVVPAESRARALADYARAQGAKRFAILRPDMAYGQRAARAFEDEVVAKGGQVVATITYSKDTLSFVDSAAKLSRSDFDAVFVPDTAAHLELIAPALALADLVAQPTSVKKPHHGRAFLLLSTAEALTPKFLKESGRYTAGAAFAPGFYPDDNDRQIGAYVSRYRAAYGDDPTYLDAYAWDATLVIRAAVEGGAQDRDSVARALAAGGRAAVHGLTGDIHFDATRGRGDRGLLYVVTPDGTAIRALRQ